MSYYYIWQWFFTFSLCSCRSSSWLNCPWVHPHLRFSLLLPSSLLDKSLTNYSKTCLSFYSKSHKHTYCSAALQFFKYQYYMSSNNYIYFPLPLLQMLPNTNLLLYLHTLSIRSYCGLVFVVKWKHTFLCVVMGSFLNCIFCNNNDWPCMGLYKGSRSFGCSNAYVYLFILTSLNPGL